MLPASPAQIYLADLRSVNESERFRSYHTFNYGAFQKEHRQPFGDLYVLNDDTLAGGQSLKMAVYESSCVILIPVVGAVDYLDSSGNQSLVNAGEMQVLQAPKQTIIQVGNPYETELVNFIQVWIRAAHSEPEITTELVDLNLEKHSNGLVQVLPLASQDQPRFCIGKFMGRHDAVYTKRHKQNRLFVFVIEGAFEVQGRLLHGRDGLSYSGEEAEIELEALSNEAIIFILELHCRW